MKKIPSLLFLVVLSAIIVLSACNRRITYDKTTEYEFEDVIVEGFLEKPSQESMAAISSAASRFGPLEGRFYIIASSVDPEEINSTMIEVLDMCESGETPLIIYQYEDETKAVILNASIREYMEILNETELYEDDIDELTYNDDGKIMFIELMREEVIDEFIFSGDDE